MARWLFILMLTLSALLPVTLHAASDKATLGHTRASLTAQYDQVEAEGAFWVLFQLDIDKGWHTYWLNPGDSGLAPTLEWTLPTGVTASDIVWQPPHRQPIGPLMNYGYSDVAYHLVKITLPKGGFSQKTLPLKVAASWLVCEEECIPEEASLSLDLPVGANIPSRRADEIADLVQKASLQTLSINKITSDATRLTIELPFKKDVEGAYLYPETAGVIEPAAPQTYTVKDGVLTLQAKRGMIEVPPVFKGLLEVRGGGETNYYSVAQAPVSVPQPLAMPATALIFTLLSAFIGGIILNAMPCVFPVLSLKALAIGQAGSDRARIRIDALAYCAGVVISFLLVGGLLLIIKAAGASVGWGYQMQSPLFVAALCYLMFLIGLNLSGVYEIGWNFGGGQGLVDRGGWVGSFATGALATLVATPCTAPFMAGALGAALTLPPVGALTIFLMLGLGLAFPFLALAWFPQLLRWMPKSGLWMETFRQFLAFPIYLTLVWLLWVLAQLAGADGVAVVLTGLIIIAFAIWMWKRVRSMPIRLAALAILAVTAAWPFVHLGTIDKAQSATQTFSIDKIETAKAEGKPVFVYATAAWCITCKVNERVALDTQEVKAFFEKKGIIVVKADWTQSDPAITNWLSGFGRSGVPLYVYYPVEGDPVVLPQVLTAGIVKDHIGSL